jgi:splicing factor U2AF subunit
MGLGFGRSSTGLGGLGGAPSQQQLHRQARRLYVGGLPIGTTDAAMRSFFDDVLSKSYMPGDHIVSVFINHEKRFGFLELRTIELTTAVLQLDGLFFNGHQLKIKRPNDYNASAAPLPSGPPILLRVGDVGVLSSQVQDGPNKIFVGGLPYHLTEADVRELLEPFGPLKSLHLVRDAGATLNKGYAFCEYVNPIAGEGACQGLNGIQISGKTMSVKKAMVATAAAAAASAGVSGLASAPLPGAMSGMGLLPNAMNIPMPMGAPIGMGMPGAMGMAFSAPLPVAAAAVAPPLPGQAAPPLLPPLPPVPAPAPVPTPAVQTCVISLHNAVTTTELEDPAEYEDILLDMKGEMERHGALTGLWMPKTKADFGHGLVFARYATKEDAERGFKALHGRTFADRLVVCKFEDEGITTRLGPNAA